MRLRKRKRKKKKCVEGKVGKEMKLRKLCERKDGVRYAWEKVCLYVEWRRYRELDLI